jgi:hypothetical protein
MNSCVNHLFKNPIAASVSVRHRPRRSALALTKHSGILEQLGQLRLAPLKQTRKDRCVDSYPVVALFRVVIPQRAVDQPGQEPKRILSNAVDKQRPGEERHGGLVPAGRKVGECAEDIAEIRLTGRRRIRKERMVLERAATRQHRDKPKRLDLRHDVPLHLLVYNSLVVV